VKQRILSALVMLPFIVFLYLGGIPLLCLCAVITVMGLWEFYHAYEKLDVHASFPIGLIFTIAMYVILIWGEFLGGRDEVYAHLILLWVFGVSIVGVALVLFKKDNNIIDGPVTSLGIFYIAFLLSHIVLIDRLPRYQLLIYLVFLCAFGTDIFAYFTGYFVGKHKLCPNLSPKKTVEGAIGGIIGSTLLCAIFGYFIYPDIILHCGVMGFIGSFFSQAGDLTASAFKRKMGIKDYSNLIPGHGGILDRFDSVIFAAPFVYYYIIIFVKP